MARRILWRSWSALEAAFELERIQGLPLVNQWLNAHQVVPQAGDVWFTTNGYDFRPGPWRKVTWVAESYQYLQNEYNIWADDRKWDLRFHFNPHYANQHNSAYHNIMTWWLRELELFEKTVGNKKPEFTFGMVLAQKPMDRSQPWMFGWYRSEVVGKSQGRSFKHFGPRWPHNPHYGGEAYVEGNRNTPVKFHDARILMTKAKFVWCLENVHDNHYSLNYLTEKIWHGFLSASVPIYCGCGNVQDLIPADIFIDVRKFNYDVTAICNFCEKMPDSEYQGYLSRIGDFLRGPGKKYTCEESFIQLDRKISGVPV
jgi:hypothetical protein